jgi:hypothetical protein
VTSRNSGIKEQISFNLPLSALGELRERAKGSETSLNEALRNVLAEYFNWYLLPEPVLDVLKADAKKRGKEDTRGYIIDLMMRRYTELIFEQQHADKKK